MTEGYEGNKLADVEGDDRDYEQMPLLSYVFLMYTALRYEFQNSEYVMGSEPLIIRERNNDVWNAMYLGDWHGYLIAQHSFNNDAASLYLSYILLQRLLLAYILVSC